MAEEAERTGWPLWAKLLLAFGVLLALLTGACIVGAVFFLPRVVQELQVTQEKYAISGILMIESALEDFAINNNGRYPQSLEALITPDERGLTYLDQEAIPLDPWGNEYVYVPPSPGTADFRVLTYGDDGLPGGDGTARDITNVMIRDGDV